MLEKIKGLRTILCGVIIVVAGALIEYQQKCGVDPTLADLCSKFIVPGWLVSGLGIAVVWFRKLAGTGK